MAILHNLSSSSAGGAGASQNFLTEQILTDAPMNNSAGPSTFATATYQGVVFTADVVGDNGNNIALVFDGVQDLTTVEATWDGGNPGNTVTWDASAYIPPVGSVTFTGGVDPVNSSALEPTTAVTFTATTAGVVGDTISLVFDGIQDINTVVAAHNAAFPANTVFHDGTGIEVPPSTTVNLAGGVDIVASTGSYDTQSWLADVPGTAGDLITLNFNGTTDTFVSALAVWNGANAGNAATRTTTDGLLVLNATTLTLSGGLSPITGIITPARVTDDWVLLSYEIYWKNGNGLDGNWIVEVCNDTALGLWVPLNGLFEMVVDADTGDIHADVSYINWRFIRLNYVGDGGSGGLATVVLNVRA